ncbi:hypothetical protein [Actinomadura sp. K4S16]|uniref:hypothetical protein n=1 Tax=Actinomadura sp. K4S16 TaxID=1316147 RepID=UPI0011ECD14E|nr:hypothetical protein [Actinomadura sp. K4S16]
MAIGWALDRAPTVPPHPTVLLPQQAAVARAYRAAAVARAVVMARAAAQLIGHAPWSCMAPGPGGLRVVLGPGTTLDQLGRAIDALEADGWTITRITTCPRLLGQACVHITLPPDLAAQAAATDQEGPREP